MTPRRSPRGRVLRRPNSENRHCAFVGFFSARGRPSGRGGAPSGIGLNLSRGDACSITDKSAGDAMSQAAQHYHVFETAMGFSAIAWSDAGVVRFQLPLKSAEAADRLLQRRLSGAEPCAPPEELAAVVAAAKRYFDGRKRTSHTSGSSLATLAARTHSSAGFMPPCAGSAGAARPLTAPWRRRSAPAARRRATSAKQWPAIRRP